MSHASHHMAASRAACRNHTGVAQAIREALRQAKEPMSCDRIASAIGRKPEKVKAAIATLIAVTGTIVSSRGPHGVVYSLYQPPQRAEIEKPNIAGPKVIRGYLW